MEELHGTMAAMIIKKKKPLLGLIKRPRVLFLMIYPFERDLVVCIPIRRGNKNGSIVEVVVKMLLSYQLARKNNERRYLLPSR